MNDPAGLLHRMPELEAVARDLPPVARALASGNPHRVYRALWWAGLRSSPHQGTIRTLLGQRRAFLMPITNAPGLITYNGIGVGCYGAAEPGEGGTHITTHFLLVLFAPIFPLGAYLVTRDGENYRFYGRVPLGTGPWLWRAALGLAVAAGILLAAGAALSSALWPELRVVNGLTMPVRVLVDGVEVEVPAAGMTTVRTRVGTVPVEAWVGERRVEALEIERGAADEQEVYSVLGAAPVMEFGVVYSRLPGDGGPPPGLRTQCGHSVATWDVDHFFEEPPESVELRGSRSEVTHTVVDLLPGGMVTCLLGAEEWGEQEQVLGLLRTLLGAFPDDPAVLHGMVHLSVPLLGRDGVLEVVRGVQEAHPEALELGRALEDLLSDAGQADEARRRFPPVSTDAPVDAQYLGLRLQAARDSTEARRAFLAAHAEHPYAKALLRHSLVWLGRHEEALALVESPEAPSYSLVDHVEILALSGRAAEALAVLGQPHDESGRLGTAAILLARDAGAPEPEWATTTAGPAVAAWLGEGEAPEKGALRALWLLHTDPGAALDELAGLTPLEVNREIPPEAAALALGEARARGRADVEALLARSGAFFPVTAETLAWLEGPGEQPPETARGSAVQAALFVARARQPGTPPEERARLLAEAPAREHLTNFVRHAVERWDW